MLTAVFGLASRCSSVAGVSTKPVRAMVRTFRRTGVARVLFGRFEGEVLDDDELDSMILMPTVVVACGLCLTALFLLGYNTLGLSRSRRSKAPADRARHTGAVPGQQYLGARSSPEGGQAAQAARPGHG